VTGEAGSLAALLAAAHESFIKPKPAPPSEPTSGILDSSAPSEETTQSPSKTKEKKKEDETWSGFFDSSSSKRIAFLNGSHRSLSESSPPHSSLTLNESTKSTVLVMPDYKLVDGVAATTEDAEMLYRDVLDPRLGRAGRSYAEGPLAGSKNIGFRSSPLPYDAVILICEFVDSEAQRRYSQVIRLMQI
jgi:hypothetical protein